MAAMRPIVLVALNRATSSERTSSDTTPSLGGATTAPGGGATDDTIESSTITGFLRVTVPPPETVTRTEAGRSSASSLSGVMVVGCHVLHAASGADRATATSGHTTDNLILMPALSSRGARAVVLVRTTFPGRAPRGPAEG
jgi:hypothetical protein